MVEEKDFQQHRKVLIAGDKQTSNLLMMPPGFGKIGEANKNYGMIYPNYRSLPRQLSSMDQPQLPALRSTLQSRRNQI